MARFPVAGWSDLNALTPNELIAEMDARAEPGGVWLVHAVSRKEARHALGEYAVAVHATESHETTDLDREDAARAFAVAKAQEVYAAASGARHVVVVRWPGPLTGPLSGVQLFVNEVVLRGSTDSISGWPERIQGRARKTYAVQVGQVFDPSVDGPELRQHVGPLIDVFVDGLRTALRLSVRDTVSLRLPTAATAEKIPECVVAAWVLLNDEDFAKLGQFLCEGGNGLRPDGDVRRIVGALVVLRRPTLLQILLKTPEPEAWTPPRLVLGGSVVSEANLAKLPGRVFQAYLRLMAPVAAWFSEALDHHAEGLVALSSSPEARALRFGLIGATTSAVQSWASELQRLVAVPGAAASAADAARTYRAAIDLMKGARPSYAAFLQSRKASSGTPLADGSWSRAHFLFEAGVKPDALTRWLTPKS